MSIMLKRAGYEVTEASDGEQAIGQVNKEIYDLVITDLRMPRADGMDVLKAVKSSSPETVVLVVTAFGTADSAVEAMKQGAYDYLTKPFQVDEVQLIIRNALEKRRCLQRTCCSSGKWPVSPLSRRSWDKVRRCKKFLTSCARWLTRRAMC